MDWRLLIAFSPALVACGTSSAPVGRDGGADSAPAETGAPIDGGSDGAIDSATQDGGSIGSCVVRPACEACIADAGVCCVYPNPNPPPGPENAIACSSCPVDAGPAFVTLTCNNEHDCPSPQVCCIRIDANKNVRSLCASTCDPAQEEVGLCDSNAASTACPPSLACSRTNIDDWNLPHCYGTCGGVSPP